MFASGLIFVEENWFPLFSSTVKAITDISDISSAYLMKKSFSETKRKPESLSLKTCSTVVDSPFADTFFSIENCKYVSNYLSLLLLGIYIKYMIKHVSDVHSHCEAKQGQYICLLIEVKVWSLESLAQPSSFRGVKRSVTKQYHFVHFSSSASTKIR